MTDRQMRRAELGMQAGLLLTGAAVASGVIWLLSVFFG